MKKLILLLMIVSLVSMAGASIKWERLASDGPGNWNVASNWDDAYVPGTQLDPPELLDYDYAVFEGFDGAANAEAQVTDAQSVGEYLRMGNGGPGGDVVRVMNGGSLTQTYISPQTLHWSAVADETDAHLIVEAGGSVDFNSHLWVGKDAGTGTIDISGTVSVGQMLGMGWTELGTGVGYINVLDGGLLALTQLHDDGISSMKHGSILNIATGGQVTLPGNRTTRVNLYIGNGTFASDGVVGPVQITFDAGANVTTLTAIPEPATMTLLGLGALALIRRKK